MKEDFSVTTNYLGLSNKGILQIKNYNDLTHYPSQNQEPFKSEMINFLNWGWNEFSLDLEVIVKFLDSKW